MWVKILGTEVSFVLTHLHLQAEFCLQRLTQFQNAAFSYNFISTRTNREWFMASDQSRNSIHNSVVCNPLLSLIWTSDTTWKKYAGNMQSDKFKFHEPFHKRKTIWLEQKISIIWQSLFLFHPVCFLEVFFLWKGSCDLNLSDCLLPAYFV